MGKKKTVQESPLVSREERSVMLLTFTTWGSTTPWLLKGAR
jgi:hypothetical protein